MTAAYERLKRSLRLGFERDKAAEQGVTLVARGNGYAAMSGFKEDGSVWVWTELTGQLHQVAPAGTVEVAMLPPVPEFGRKSKVGF